MSCQALKLRHAKISCSVLGIGHVVQKSSHEVCALIKSLVSEFKSNIEFLLLPTLTNNLTLMRINMFNIYITKNIRLAEPQYFRLQKINIILGTSIFFELLGTGRIRRIENGVYFQEMHLGYIISGQVSNTTKKSESSSVLLVQY